MGFKPDINACNLNSFKHFNINADAYCQSVPSKFTKRPIFFKGPSINALVLSDWNPLHTCSKHSNPTFSAVSVLCPQNRMT